MHSTLGWNTDQQGHLITDDREARLVTLVRRRTREPYEVYIGLGTDAGSIQNFEPPGIPGLVRTGDYVQAMVNTPKDFRGDRLDYRNEVRGSRQRIPARRRQSVPGDVRRRGLHPPSAVPPSWRPSPGIGLRRPSRARVRAGRSVQCRSCLSMAPRDPRAARTPLDSDLVYIETSGRDIDQEERTDVHSYTLDLSGSSPPRASLRRLSCLRGKVRRADRSGQGYRTRGASGCPGSIPRHTTQEHRQRSARYPALKGRLQID